LKCLVGTDLKNYGKITFVCIFGISTCPRYFLSPEREWFGYTPAQRGRATYPTSAKPKDGWPDITKEHVRRKESPCSFRLSATESHETM
jgi:hypothetical protein